MTTTQFKKVVWEYYRVHGRIFPWRNTKDPYKILVSEIMLQQTQAERVVLKYQEFIKTFPTVSSLAHAPLSHVLSVWKGLGYNRRAVYLRLCAQKIVKDHGKIFPKTISELTRLPGIGVATAGDIVAFAWNMPAVVIETNIRSVFIYHFFKNAEKVHDSDIHKLVRKTLDTHNPREWYFALMDYGAYLKKIHPNPNRASAHYVKQSPFHGSNRELRSHILSTVMERRSIPQHKLVQYFSHQRARVLQNIDAMKKEGLISVSQGIVKI